MAQFHVSKKKRYEGDDAELLKKVSGQLVTKETLREKLSQHVEQVSLLAGLVSELLIIYVLFLSYQGGEQSVVHGLTCLE